MELLIAVILGGSCAAAGAYLVQRRLRRKVGASPPRRSEEVGRDLENPRPDDVLSIDGVDWIVTGVAQLTEGGDHWIECRLRDSDHVGWLLLSIGDVDGVAFGHRISDPGVGRRPAASLDIEGSLFRLQRQGQATVSRIGDLGTDYPTGSCSYWNYRRPGEERVWIRGHEASWIYIAGRRIRRHFVSFLPGS